MESKLFNVRCDNCGSEYRINSRGEMNCPFCGSKIYLNDKDFEAYQKARDEMLVKDKVDNDIANSDGDILNKWTEEYTETMTTANGKTVNIRYGYVYSKATSAVYVGRNKVAIIFNELKDAQLFVRNSQCLQYPSADIKGLSMFFPRISFTVELTHGKHLVVMDKPENVYPLIMFNRLGAKHVAWIISRMENFGCLFEYNSVDLWALEKSDIYINPKTHHVYILCGWEYLSTGAPQKYLKRLREVAIDTLRADGTPQECADFLMSEPKPDAYSDFKAWDYVIEHGFSGHNFTIFSED